MHDEQKGKDLPSAASLLAKQLSLVRLAMMLSNYEIMESIAESPKSSIFKVVHKKNPSRILILKVIKSGLSENKKAQIRQKIEHLKVLNDPLLITPISFSDKDSICFITQEYFEGITLDKYLATHPKKALKDLLTIASGMA
jgi:serine/threonine protein kinase